MMKTKIKIVKPVDTSISLIYNCPQCDSKHWISLKAAQTKGFIIVCDCGMVFKPRLVDKIRVVHKKKTKTLASNKIPSVVENIVPKSVLDACVSVLLNYGFTKSEASELIKKTYNQQPINDAATLIKLSLSLNLGEKNDKSN